MRHFILITLLVSYFCADRIGESKNQCSCNEFAELSFGWVGWQVWDLRKYKTPLKTFGDLPNSYAQTTVSFSPDERLIMTGTSTEKEANKGGLLVFFNKERLELVRRVGVSANQSVVCSIWHTRLNQV